MKTLEYLIVAAALTIGAVSCGSNPGKNAGDAAQGDSAPLAEIYNFKVADQNGNQVSLDKYKGKVLLIVNTATRCGFTPQYEELEAMYSRLSAKGLEILDFPCNQFGQQAPGTDAEIAEFCKLNYKTEFPQFSKIDVNGEGESPLFTYLKSQKGFDGFDEGNALSPLLGAMLSKADPQYSEKPDIKWNFTKFLVDREGNVVVRFEPTHDMADVEAQVRQLLMTPDELYATDCLSAGTPAPDFTLKDAEGRDFSLSSLKGKIVVLDFWASWCPDCRKITPDIKRLSEKYSGRKVRFVGVSFDHDRDAWTSYLEKSALDKTVQVSELKKWKETEVSKAYNINWIPTMYVIGKDGKVLLATVQVENLEAKLKELTGR